MPLFGTSILGLPSVSGTKTARLLKKFTEKLKKPKKAEYTSCPNNGNNNSYKNNFNSCGNDSNNKCKKFTENSYLGNNNNNC